MRTMSETVFLLGSLVLIVSILSVMIVFLYMAYFRMGKILEGLGNSHAILIKKRSLGVDPVSRLLLMNCISALFVFSRQAVKSGDMSLEDYERFPAGLKRMIEFCGRSMIVLTAVTVMFITMGKYQGWL